MIGANGLSANFGWCRMSCGSNTVRIPGVSARHTSTVAKICGWSVGMMTVLRSTGTPACRNDFRNCSASSALEPAFQPR